MDNNQFGIEETKTYTFVYRNYKLSDPAKEHNIPVVAANLSEAITLFNNIVTILGLNEACIKQIIVS